MPQKTAFIYYTGEKCGLAVIAVGVALAVKYAGGDADKSPSQEVQAEKKGGVQVQEKYGFAPVGEDE